MLVFLMLAAALPASSTPLDGLHYLVGTWNCTYVGGGEKLAYSNTYAYDSNGHILRQVTSSSAGGDEELLAYDVKLGWTAVVFDDHGNTTVMRAPGSDPNHIAYRSFYPDTSIATTFDRVSATEYTLHGKYRVGGKAITSVDTCVRAAH
ncbi:MAG: hypothetical protein ABIZ82_11465 [Candidatus Tumulicola sp.]